MLFPSVLLPVLLLVSSPLTPVSARRSHGNRASSSGHLISQSVDSQLTNTRRRMDLVVERTRELERAPSAVVVVDLSPVILRPRMDVYAEKNRVVHPPLGLQKRQVVSKRCKVRPSAAALVAAAVTTTAAGSPSAVASSSAAQPTTTSAVVEKAPTTTSQAPAAPTTTQAAAPTTTAQAQQPATTTHAAAPVVQAAGWPTVTQAGAIPSATATSASDPFLLSASYALNNAGNALFTAKKTKGELTYYAQGQTSCGSVYDDTSFTAAVSKEMYDSWPGAGIAANRNPICGPFAPGRLSLTSEVLVPSTSGTVLIGGDGLLNCVAGEMCHIPLTATLTYNGKTAKVQIVDRCEGCAMEDIDVTPAVFEHLTGNMGLGRIMKGTTDFSWSFDAY